MFLDLETMSRIERAEARLVAEGGDMLADLRPESDLQVFRPEGEGGWAAAYAGPHAPFTKWSGLGFGRLPTPEEFQRVEARFDAEAAPLSIELASGADPAAADTLSQRGYRLQRFENVLVRPLADLSGLSDAPSGVEVSSEGEAGFAPWLTRFLDAFAVSDDQGVGDAEEFPREVLAEAVSACSRCRGFRRYAATLDGDPAGTAAMRLDPGLGADASLPPIVMLCGAATAPQHRRRGVQTALLVARLQDAAGAGADLAVVTTLPGSKSEQNAIRAGFRLGYVRAVMVREARPSA